MIGTIRDHMTDGGVDVFVASVGEAVALKKALLNRDNKSRIYAAGATEHKQANAALGLLTADDIEAVRLIISTCRDECHALEAEIDAIAADETLSDAEKIAAIDAVFW